MHTVQFREASLMKDVDDEEDGLIRESVLILSLDSFLYSGILSNSRLIAEMIGTAGSFGES